MKNGLTRFFIVILFFFSAVNVISRPLFESSTRGKPTTKVTGALVKPQMQTQQKSSTTATSSQQAQGISSTQAATTLVAEEAAQLRAKLAKIQEQQREQLQREQELPSQKILKQEQLSGDTASWSLEGAATGAAERLKAFTSYGWEKIKGFSESVFGSYQSSFSTGAKVGFGVAAVALFPYFGPAAALTYLTGLGLTTGMATFIGGSAAGLSVYALTSAFDKLEHRYATGNWTDEAAINAARGLLEVTLSDSGTYPYYQAKIEALNTANELSISKDETTLFSNIVKQVCQNLAKEYSITVSKLSKADQDREKAFMEFVYKLRVENNCNVPSEASVDNLDKYIKALSKPEALGLAEKDTDFLIRCQAVLSEYNRALKIKALKESQQQGALSTGVTESGIGMPGPVTN